MELKGVVVAAGAPSDSPASRDDCTGATALIANRPVVAHAVDVLRSVGIRDVAIVGCSAALEPIRDSLRGVGLDGSLTFLTAPGRADFVALLAAADRFVADSPCLVQAANGVVEHPLPPVHELTGPDAPDMTLFVHHGSTRGRPVDGNVERLLGVSELRRGRNGLGVAGFGMIGARALRYASSLPRGSADHGRDLAHVAGRIADAGGRLQVGRVRSWCEYGGRPQDLLEMNRIVLDCLEGSSELIEGDDNRSEGRVQIDPTAEIVGSVISGPVVIGEHARIIDAYIGPYTSIGPGAEVSGSEVERSIVGARARIRHVGVRVQASTVGPDAEIFRDFALPRAMRMHVGAGVQLALE